MGGKMIGLDWGDVSTTPGYAFGLAAPKPMRTRWLFLPANGLQIKAWSGGGEKGGVSLSGSVDSASILVGEAQLRWITRSPIL